MTVVKGNQENGAWFLALGSTQMGKSALLHQEAVNCIKPAAVVGPKGFLCLVQTAHEQASGHRLVNLING